MEIFAFCVITFEPIKIQTHFTPQNDLTFVKDEKYSWPKNGQKWSGTAIYLV